MNRDLHKKIQLDSRDVKQDRRLLTPNGGNAFKETDIEKNEYLEV